MLKRQADRKSIRNDPCIARWQLVQYKNKYSVKNLIQFQIRDFFRQQINREPLEKSK